MLLFVADFFQNADTNAMLTVMQKTFQWDVASYKSPPEQSIKAKGGTKSEFCLAGGKEGARW